MHNNCDLARVQELEAENLILRRLLWMVYSQGRGYGDDGELQFEMIDFKRMSAQEIDALMQRRAMQNAAEFCKSAEGKQLLSELGLS
jgi:hypothetical protein